MNGKAEAVGATPSRIPPRYGEAAAAGSGPVVFALLAILGSAAILFLFNPAQSGFYPVCLFHQSTGLLCPGCGSLRALHQLLHGNVIAALHFNALLVLLLPVVAWLGCRSLIARLKHRAVDIQIRPGWLWCGLAVLIVFGVLRNLPFAQTAWLAP
jgi:uncharacterized protein DUF2752